MPLKQHHAGNLVAQYFNTCIATLSQIDQWTSSISPNYPQVAINLYTVDINGEDIEQVNSGNAWAMAIHGNKFWANLSPSQYYLYPSARPPGPRYVSGFRGSISITGGSYEKLIPPEMLALFQVPT